jgi:iron complex outermembrane receptor protein
MYEFRHMAGIYLDLANLAPARDRYLHNVGVTYRPVPDLSLAFQVNNLTDEHYQDFYNQPLPGRAYYFTLRLDDWSFLSKLFR